MPKEGKFQTEFRKRLEELFPGCIVSKTDSRYRQGVPDLVMFWEDKWAVFEMKASFNSAKQTNQAYYINLMDDMSFAAFVHPDNAEEVLDDLQRSLSS